MKLFLVTYDYGTRAELQSYLVAPKVGDVVNQFHRDWEQAKTPIDYSLTKIEEVEGLNSHCLRFGNPNREPNRLTPSLESEEDD